MAHAKISSYAMVIFLPAGFEAHKITGYFYFVVTFTNYTIQLKILLLFFTFYLIAAVKHRPVTPISLKRNHLFTGDMCERL